MAGETGFIQTSHNIVRNFLSSVVLVDDQAYLKNPVERVVTKLVVPPGRQGAEATDKVAPNSTKGALDIKGNAATESSLPNVESDKNAPIPSTAASVSTERSHTLDGKSVIDAFAEIGVVCGIMRPEKNELDALPETLAKVGSNADAVILDWVLHDSQSGERTLLLIQKLVTSATQTHRARLILVYTAEPDLLEIESKIRKALELDTTGPEQFAVAVGGTRICLYGKAGMRAGAIEQTRIKTPGELAEVVVREFSQMSRGLVSNVAMKSISSVRARTFQLLSRFGPELDAPYVTQSALISPEKAEEQLAALIVSEINEILEDDEVALLASYERIVEWLDYQKANNCLSLPTSKTLSADDSYKGLLQLIKGGIRKDELAVLDREHSNFFRSIVPGSKKAPRMYVRNGITNLLRVSSAGAGEVDEQWTMLMSLRHRYTSPPPQLALGSIVARQVGEETKYLLCLQPLCDSVRLVGKRDFPLLLLSPAEGANSCDLIIKDGELRGLNVKWSPYLLEMIPFAPSHNEKVVATKQDYYFWFTATDGTRYRWVADLKPAHAQRVANRFGSTFSRVGLIESEWNRLGSSW